MAPKVATDQENGPESPEMPPVEQVIKVEDSPVKAEIALPKVFPVRERVADVLAAEYHMTFIQEEV